ncbi:hypothetical protein E1B28_005551 [Marasmius oreades]|uniref:Fungal-type protein kinase domain-containing protein n=1 Tax=Marasmius oreades TaxID=181124 RepID=A0A9P7S433_9AGAR|nr:uncharacterized protein E1B28_005551 [Marasmius oreades]KAG7094732.1 hypothetical protein E1B28_005551 [Marasmius oreades]
MVGLIFALERERETTPLSKVVSAVAKVVESCGVKAGEYDAMGYRHFSDARCVSKDTKIQLRRSERNPTKKIKILFSHVAHNVSVLGELQLHDATTTAEDDEKKLIFAANEIMYDDPTRRFIFGFTIEATMMQI